MRKYDKNEYVNTTSIFSGEFLGVGKILGWTYDRSTKTYEYLVQNIDNRRKGYFENEQLENFKINLAKEDEEKMNRFYKALTDSTLEVTFDQDPKKQTYTLVGRDLKQAKSIFRRIVWSQ